MPVVEEVAESTPAPEVTPEPVAPPVEGDILEPEKTAPAETPEESATPDKPESDKTDESVPASEAAKRPDGSKAEARIRQLTAKLKNVERQLQETTQRVAAPPPQAPVAPAKPKLDQFETVEAYDSAIEKWKDDSVKYEASIAVERDRQTRAYKAQQEELSKQQQEIATNWQKRVEKAAPQIADLKDALDDAAQGLIPRNETMDGFILDSDYGPVILHHLWQNPDEAEKIAAMPPYKAVREMHNLELRVANQVKGINPKSSTVVPPRTVRGKDSPAPKPKSLEDLLYG